VAALPVLIELALPFCAIGGLFIAQKKGDIQQEIYQSENVLKVIGGRFNTIRPVSVIGLEDDRVLVIIEKMNLTPPTYPRRPGMPEKRPL
jgi:16S rRNA (guanine527-N7)-methyltransferase